MIQSNVQHDPADRSARRLRRAAWFLAMVYGLSTGSASAHPGAHHDVERLTGLLKERPDDVALLIERAHYARLDHQFSLALGDLDHAQSLASDRPDIHFHRGRVFADESKLEAAESEFTRAIEGGLMTGQAFAARARLRVRIEKLDSALADYNQSILLEPDFELFVERGELQTSLNLLDEAESGYREAIAKLGDAFVIRSAQIDLAERRGSFKEAVKLVDEQLARSRIKSDWLLKRAEILERAGDTKSAGADRRKALDEINAAIARRPVGIHLVTRAKVYLAMGRRDAARQDVLLALSKSPTFGAAQELLSKLESDDAKQPVMNPSSPIDAAKEQHAAALREGAGQIEGDTAKPSARE